MYKKYGSAHTLDGFPAALLTAMRALDSNRHRIAKASGTTWSELRAIARVAEAGSITPKELAISLEMTTGAVTAISSRLVESGLLRRTDHPHDHRSLLLELTPRGDSLMKAVYVELEASIATSTAGIDAAELRACSEVLLAVSEQLELDAPTSVAVVTEASHPGL